MMGCEQRDPEDLHPVCYNCHESTETLDFEVSIRRFRFTERLDQEDVCARCGHPFMRCFVTFDILPVTEIFLEDGISLNDVKAILESSSTHSDELSENSSGPEILRLDNSMDAVSLTDGPFSPSLGETIRLSLSQLKELDSKELLLSPAQNDTFRIYRVFDHSVPLCIGECGHLFIKDEYQQYCLEHGNPPFL